MTNLSLAAMSLNSVPADPSGGHRDRTDERDLTLGVQREIKHHISSVAERVEQLLVRHEALQRANAALRDQLDALASERDSLRSRLSAARARVEALIERLPDNAQVSSHGALE